MPTAIVTGANSGIANAFAQILVKEVSIFTSLIKNILTGLQGYKVIAADVNTDGPIKELGCEVIKLDISSTEDIQASKQKVGDQPIDLLLNIAGTPF